MRADLIGAQPSRRRPSIALRLSPLGTGGSGRSAPGTAGSWRSRVRRRSSIRTTAPRGWTWALRGGQMASSVCASIAVRALRRPLMARQRARVVLASGCSSLGRRPRAAAAALLTVASRAPAQEKPPRRPFRPPRPPRKQRSRPQSGVRRPRRRGPRPNAKPEWQPKPMRLKLRLPQPRRAMVPRRCPRTRPPVRSRCAPNSRTSRRSARPCTRASLVALRGILRRCRRCRPSSIRSRRSNAEACRSLTSSRASSGSSRLVPRRTRQRRLGSRRCWRSARPSESGGPGRQGQGRREKG